VVIGQQPHLLTLAALYWHGTDATPCCGCRRRIISSRWRPAAAAGGRGCGNSSASRRRPAAGVGRNYDGLAARVRDFQLQHDLPGDGIAGPLTTTAGSGRDLTRHT
jgi:general secretion pathway protein A